MQRILVKAAPGLSETKLTFGAAAVSFEVEPLFKSIGSQSAFGAAADDVWYVLKPKEAVDDQKNPWDVCHQLMKDGFGIAGPAAPKFAEPDIEQKWITGSPSEAGQSLVQSCADHDPQNPAFPVNGDNYWFRDATHSQFDTALAAIGGPDVASKVRIAHFDTGYDPNHHSLPKHLRRDIARNFVDDGNPNDASDQTERPADQSRSWHRHAQHPGRNGHCSGNCPGRSALCRSGPGPRRQPRRALQQQLDRQGVRLRARAQCGRHPRRHHHHEHGRACLAGLGGCGERAVRAGRFHRHCGRQQFRQSADPQRRLSRALQPRGGRLRRDGERQALCRSRAEPDGRQLRADRQDVDGDCGADAERAMGAPGLPRHGRLRRRRDLGGDAAGCGRSRNLAAEEPHGRRRLSGRVDAHRGDPQGAVRECAARPSHGNAGSAPRARKIARQ